MKKAKNLIIAKITGYTVYKSREEVHHTLICPELELYNMFFILFQLFTDCNLLQRIMEVWEENDQQQ